MIPYDKNGLSITLKEDGVPVNEWIVDSGAANVIGYMLDALDEVMYVPLVSENLHHELSESIPFLHFDNGRMLTYDIERVMIECKKKQYVVMIENKVGSSWAIRILAPISKVVLEETTAELSDHQEPKEFEQEYVKISDVPGLFEKYLPEAVKQMDLVSAEEVKRFIATAFANMSSAVK